jgi:Rap1a immunity proteins
MRLATILMSVCLLAATTADAAKWESAGSQTWGACARALRPIDTPDNGYNAVLCDGTINAVIFMKDDICMPEGVSRQQATRVVVRYFEAHPELWGRPCPSCATRSVALPTLGAATANDAGHQS